MVPISRYFLFFSFFFFFFWDSPVDLRILVFQLVVSMYSVHVRRSVHSSNAPPTSKLLTASELFSLHKRRVPDDLIWVYYLKRKARSGCSVTSCEANGWRELR